MTGGSWSWCTRGVNWWIRRNPMYLLSAAAMALGARWYLVAPDAPAGEIGLIVLTLGVLQAYELAVTGVLILLHRRRKSPEDQPSLLLVAALFWTGPMAATVEMTARDRAAGVGFAAAACLIALIELHAVRRAIGLRLSGWCQLAVSACVVLLAAAPARLRLAHAASGTDEVALYLFWWLLAGLVLLSLGALAWHARRQRDPASAHVGRRATHVEMAFLGIVFAAAAGHLWGMSYAFFGNARAFYAAPVLTALTVALFDYLARLRTRSPWLWGVCATLPAVAIALATEGFSEEVPLSDLPAPLRDPLLSTLAISAAAWWFGCVRGGSPLLLHAGSAAVATAALRLVGVPDKLPADFEPLRAGAVVACDEAAILAYALAVYLLAIGGLRRSRAETVAAVAVHVVAFALLIWNRTPADLMLTCLLAGWTWLVVLHVVLSRPRWTVTVWPVALLVFLTAAFGWQAELKVYAAAHGAAMVVLLVAAGWLWPWTRYRTLGAVASGTFLTLAAGHGVMRGAHSRAAIAVLSAFLLLTAGAATSWYKRRLLDMTAADEPDSEARRPAVHS